MVDRELQDILVRRYSQMEAKDKWQEVLKLRQMAWQMKRAGVKAQHPDWDAIQVEQKVREIFLHAST